MLNIITALMIWCVLLPTFYGMGKLCSVKRLIIEDSLMLGICYVAIGLGVVGYLIIAAGTFNVLRFEFMIVGLLLMFLVSITTFRECASWGAALVRHLFLIPADSFAKALRIIFCISIVLSLLSMLVPEIANDSLAYHINLPKLFIQRQSVMPLIYDEKSYRSLFMEELFVIPMFFKNIPAVIFFHWLTGFLLCAALVLWIEREVKSYSWALFFGVLLWLTPTLFNQIAISYTDGSVAFFSFLSIYLLGLGWEQPDKKNYFWFAGILMGISVGCKLLSVMTAVSIAFVFLFLLFLRKNNRKALFYGSLIFGIAMGIACMYWFVRNWILTGDVLYPLITKKFGTTGLYADQKFSTIGVSKNLINFFLLPFHVTFFPDTFNRYHWVGPAYLFLAPFIYFAAFTVRRALPVFIIAFASTLFWFLSAQDIRFVLTAIPLWLWVASMSLVPNLRNFPSLLRKAAYAMAVLGLVGYLALGFYHYRVQLKAVLQGWDESTFLTRMERSYPVAKWVNQNLPRSVKILNAWEVRTYYFDRELIDSSMYFRIHRDMKNGTPSEIYRMLKTDGFTHVLRCRSEKESVGPQKVGIYSALDKALADKTLFLTTYQYKSVNIREDKYIYDLYELR